MTVKNLYDEDFSFEVYTQPPFSVLPNWGIRNNEWAIAYFPHWFSMGNAAAIATVTGLDGKNSYKFTINAKTPSLAWVRRFDLHFKTSGGSTIATHRYYVYGTTTTRAIPSPASKVEIVVWYQFWTGFGGAQEGFKFPVKLEYW